MVFHHLCLLLLEAPEDLLLLFVVVLLQFRELLFEVFLLFSFCRLQFFAELAHLLDVVRLGSRAGLPLYYYFVRRSFVFFVATGSLNCCLRAFVLDIHERAVGRSSNHWALEAVIPVSRTADHGVYS